VASKPGVEVVKLVDSLFSLVGIPLYSAAGVVAGDRILVSALAEGARNVYVLDGGRLVKLNREPVYIVAEPPHGAERVVIGRDVARGRELIALYTVKVDEPGVEEPLAEGLEPTRILGLVDKGDRVYVTGVAGQGIGVFEAEPGGRARLLGYIPGIGALTDASEGLGVGLLFKPTGRITLLTMDLSTGEAREHDLGGSVTQARIVEGRVVAAVEYAREARLVEFDPGSGEARPLQLPHGDLEEYSPTAFNYVAQLPSGEIVAVARKHGRSRVFVDGRLVPAPEGVHGAAYRWRSGLAVAHTSLREPMRIVYLAGGEWEAVVEPAVPGEVREALGGVGFHWVESFDGEKVPTFTLESGLAGKPGPTVVLVHGGPFSEYLDAWNIFAVAIALAGYHVVMPNYRGSTGYGEEWRNKIIGDPCGAELEDIVASARWAREAGLAEYSVIMGYSYGGYATMCALTRKPGVFRAGVAGASVVDWEEMYELSDPAFKMFIELLFGGADRGKWRERSPIEYVDGLRDPLCIVHPQNDTRTPLKPVLHFMERAVEKGKRFEAHIAPDMGHAINTVDDVIKILLPAVLFLDAVRRGRA